MNRVCWYLKVWMEKKLPENSGLEIGTGCVEKVKFSRLGDLSLEVLLNLQELIHGEHQESAQNHYITLSVTTGWNSWTMSKRMTPVARKINKGSSEGISQLLPRN